MRASFAPHANTPKPDWHAVATSACGLVLTASYGFSAGLSVAVTLVLVVKVPNISAMTMSAASYVLWATPTVRPAASVLWGVALAMLIGVGLAWAVVLWQLRALLSLPLSRWLRELWRRGRSEYAWHGRVALMQVGICTTWVLASSTGVYSLPGWCAVLWLVASLTTSSDVVSRRAASRPPKQLHGWRDSALSVPPLRAQTSQTSWVGHVPPLVGVVGLTSKLLLVGVVLFGAAQVLSAHCLSRSWACDDAWASSLIGLGIVFIAAATVASCRRPCSRL